MQPQKPAIAFYVMEDTRSKCDEKFGGLTDFLKFEHFQKGQKFTKTEK